MLNIIKLHHLTNVSKVEDERVRTFIAMLKVSNAIVAEVSLGAYIGEEMKDYLRDGMHELMLNPEMVNDLRQQLLASGGG